MYLHIIPLPVAKKCFIFSLFSLLIEIEKMFADTRITDTILGPVIQAGMDALKVIFNFLTFLCWRINFSFSHVLFHSFYFFLLFFTLLVF